MNVGTQNIVYGRRRAVFTRSNSSYLQMSLDMRHELESDEEWDVSSSSAISTRSTKSMKSYKRWRREQREKRRNLKLTGLEAGSSEKTLEALDLSGDYGSSNKSGIYEHKGKEFTKAEVASVQNKNETSHSDAHKLTKQLSSIAQSPIEPFYSSSPLTTSSEDSVDISTPPQLPSEDEEKHHSHSELYGPTEELSSQPPSTFQFTKIFPLKKRDFEENVRPPYSLSSRNISIKKRSASASDTDRTPGAAKSCDRSLLSLARTMSQPGLDEVAYDETGGNKDVVYSDQNGFTIALPAHSPSVPSHMVTDDISPAKTEEDGTPEYERKSEKGTKENERSSEAFPTDDSTREDGKLPCTEEKLPGQGNMDSQFLPPLITKALKQKSLDKLDIKGTRDRNLNITQIANDTTDNQASEFSTEEEFEENVYLENANDIFDDLVEKEFLGIPTKTPTAEQYSDDGSHVTKGSIDPIENILVREDDVTADDRTFTLNGRAVITPKSVEENVKNGEMEVKKGETTSDDVAMPDVPEVTPQGVAEAAHSKELPSSTSSETKMNRQQTDVSDACPDFCCVIL